MREAADDCDVTRRKDPLAQIKNMRRPVERRAAAVSWGRVHDDGFNRVSDRDDAECGGHQLGLKLERRREKASFDVLVIKSVELPSEN